ncbi:cytochrome P450 716B1-like [Nicotiana sylvestris]|uniref:Cytochrome P450 716B1-like n=1 Tax=Nicotiana sylvestris TaxID=4096 RepID=A0A1U7Y4M7_NICSY|nr:PREDICTED: cytochrome P450 716B1-like [Nicotiana sylvestris]XP_016467163.1 PREDICTED: cytochrome P450 716B1-like [Nicotiana tabacum]
MNIILTIFLFLLPFFLLLVHRRRPSKRVPPGSLGLPIIGQSLGMLRAMRTNTAEKWLEERVQKYGPISKLNLFGKPTVFIYGQAANKFIFTSDGSVLTNQQTQSVKMILGERCLFELNGEDHKRVRDALLSFLKPDSLKRYVGKMEEEVRIHLETYWKGKQIVKVLPLMKTLTFDIICSLLFGLERGARRDQMVQYFQRMIEGMWSIPINLPFTRFNRSLKASKDGQKMLKQLIREKQYEFENNLASSHQDLITCLLSIRGENNQQLISENEIIHNVMLIMVAGHDTSSVLITFIVRLLAKNPNIHVAVLKEQEEIAQSKSPEESLTWEDLGKMKYTWRVAMETMRIFPPIFGGFRQTVKDIEYGGYLIPKGWQIFWVTAKTHLDSSIFQEPEKFDPARFENPGSLPPYNFVPFGGGARICPGYEFAKIETLVTIHYLVTHFAWKLCCTDDFFSRDPMPAPTQGLPIQIIPRKPI